MRARARAHGPARRARPAWALAPALALALAVAAPLVEAQSPPVAKFSVSPGVPLVGQEVLASAAPVSKAFPPCEPLAAYAWDWDGDGAFEANGTAATARHTFATPGEHRVTLRVTDACGATADASLVVTVNAAGADGAGRGLDFSIVIENAGSFLRAAWLVLGVSGVVILAGLPLGVLVGLARLSRVAPVRWVAGAYVEFLRGTPLLVQIFIVWLALPQISPGLKFSALVSGMIALVINTSAYQGEIIRAGIQAIPAGQTEAALGLGLSRWQTTRHVVLPQAMRLVIPPLTNEFIILIKDTSLLSVIGVVELMLTARVLGNRHFSIVEPLIAVALLYFVMTYSLSLVLQRMERKLAIPGLGVKTGGYH